MRRGALTLVLLALVPASACGRGATDGVASTPPTVEAPEPEAHATETAEPAPSDEAPRRVEPRAAVFQRSRDMMGTIFQITVLGEATPAGEAATDAALDEIGRLESVLSEWIPDSEMSQVNTNAGVHPVKVGADTLAVVRAGLEVSRWSGGAFDISWAALHGLYDFREGHHRAPTDAELAPKLKLIDWKRIALDERKSTVFLKQKGMAIGTGGIGKGYSLDRAKAVLLERGFDNFMIFGGGQVTVQGKRGDRAWKVGIQHPRMNDYFAFLEATEGSISTSGDYEHTFVDDQGKRWHHIIDTHTGRPVDGTLSVTLLAPDGLHADALSTACFVLGPPKCLAMLAKVPGRPEAVIVDTNFQIHTTPGTEKRLTFTMSIEDGVLPHESPGTP